MDAGIALDPVVALLSAERSDYRGLYYRWEREQWEAGKVDFSVDADQWSSLEPALRVSVSEAVGWRHLRARLAADALVAFVDAAPHEEQQVFLTTQLADEARHIVLFDRFSTEVVRHDATSISGRAPDVADEDVRVLLLDALVDTARRVAAVEDPDLKTLSEAVTIYQIGIEGMLGLTQQRFLVEELTSRDHLPGLRRGLSLAGRDAHRHVAFALRLLQEAVAADDRVLAVSHDALRKVSPRVLRAVAASARSGGIGADDVVEGARQTCAGWFEAVGLEAPVLD